MINCRSQILRTHDDYASPYTIDCAENNSIYTAGAIADYKCLELLYEYLPDESDSQSDQSQSCSISDASTLPDNLEIYFNTWMFGAANHYTDYYSSGLINDKPAQGWWIKYDFQGMPNGTEQNMTLYGSGLNANCNKNIRCTFTPMGCDRFLIKMYFYLTMDLDYAIDGTLINVHDRLLKGYISAPTELDNSVQSVYNFAKELITLIYIRDAIKDNYGTVIEVRDYSHEFHVPCSFRFYNKDLYDAVSPITPEFTLLRGGHVVTDFSVFEQTQVRIDLTSATEYLNRMSLWLIRTDTNDNTLTFVGNYDGSFGNIENVPAAGQLDNHIYSPSTLAVATGLTTGTAYIDETLEENGKYRLIAVGYGFDTTDLSFTVNIAPGSATFTDATYATGVFAINCANFGSPFTLYHPGNTDAAQFIGLTPGIHYFQFKNGEFILMDNTGTDVWSFISDEISVSAIPPCHCHLGQVHSWADYSNNDWNSDSIITSTHDRLRAYGRLNISDLQDCIETWCAEFGIDPYPAGYSNPAAYRITKLQCQVREEFINYPMTGKNTYAIYDEIECTRDSGSGQWTIPDSRIQITESISQLRYSFDFRTRYESNILPMDVRLANTIEPEDMTTVGSQINNYCTALNINNDWTGRHIQVVWKAYVDFPDAPQPFTQCYVYKERVYVHEDDTIYAYPYLENIRLFAPDMTEILDGQVCKDYDFIYVRVRAFTSTPDESCSISDSASGCTDCDQRNIIATLDVSMYSEGNLKEEETWLGGGTIQQLTTEEIYDLDAGIDADCDAWFKIDCKKLTLGTSYRICVLSKETYCPLPLTPPQIIATVSGGNWGSLTPGVHYLAPTSYQAPTGTLSENWKFNETVGSIYYMIGLYAGTTAPERNQFQLYKNPGGTQQHYCTIINNSKIHDCIFTSLTSGGTTISIQRACNWESNP